MKKPIIFLLVLITNILFISAQKISKTELKDKIAGAWIGQMVGNIYGLPFENKFVDEPAPESRFPFGYTKNIDKLQKYNGAFSDDDTDVEYIYLLLMEKYGVEPTYANMREGWMYHIRDRVWLANRAALGLMHLGFTPPFTGDENLNPHWYQIDPQLINEIWAYTAPGMISYAAGKSDWAARITSDSWAVSPTVLYGAMYADAFFCKDIRKLITRALKELPADDRYATAVKEMIALYDKYPKDWVKARQIMAKKYYIDEPAMTKTIWNANLNGLCGILAMLYGEGDFQRTLDLSCAMGFDCDNQAATISGLLGVMYGAKSLPESLTKPIEGWEKPFTGTDVIRIEGVKKLHGAEYSVIPDQIEAGTFMMAAAATRGDITVKNVIPKHLDCLSSKLREIGCEVSEFDDAVRVVCKERLHATSVNTLPYPGFPTDMQPQMSVVLALARGTSVVTESIFDNRFRYVDELIRMGASIQVESNIAIINGIEQFSGTSVTVPDLRAGAALVIAGLAAQGVSVLEDIVYIKRGYEDFAEKLTSLGGVIEEVETEKDIQRFRLKNGTTNW